MNRTRLIVWISRHAKSFEKLTFVPLRPELQLSQTILQVIEDIEGGSNKQAKECVTYYWSEIWPEEDHEILACYLEDDTEHILLYGEPKHPLPIQPYVAMVKDTQSKSLWAKFTSETPPIFDQGILQFDITLLSSEFVGWHLNVILHFGEEEFLIGAFVVEETNSVFVEYDLSKLDCKFLNIPFSLFYFVSTKEPLGK